MMKRFIYTVLCSIFVSSCIAEVTRDVDGLHTFDTFYVTIESPNHPNVTKAHIEELTKVKWDVGDEIGVYSDIQAPVKYVRNQDGSFSGPAVSGSVFYAFYPYNAGGYNQDNPSQLKMTLKQDMIPMVAKSQENNLVFRQTVGMLHFRVKWNKDVRYSILTDKEYRPLFGEGSIDMDSNTPKFILSEGQQAQTTLVWRHGSYPDEEDGYTIYDFLFAVPEMVMDKGFTVEFISSEKNGDGTNLQFVKSTGKPCEIKRGRIKSYELVDVNAEFEESERTLEEERECLMALYRALDGEHWTNNTNWGSDEPVWKWFGVRGLFDANGHGFRVWELSLPDNNLTGSIPEDIGRLSGLRVLNISGNSITGELPKSLARLQLMDFYCQGNQIAGPLVDISGMSNISTLSLANNNFTGTIPANYACFMERGPEQGYSKWFDISGNRLSGQLPQDIVTHPRFPDYAYRFMAKQQAGYKIDVDENHLPAPKGIYKTLDGEDVDLGKAYSNSNYTLIIQDQVYSTIIKDDVLWFANKYKDSGLQVLVALSEVKEGNDYNDFLLSHHYDTFPSPIIASFDWVSDQGDYRPVNPTYGGSELLVNREGYVVFINSETYYERYSFGPTLTKNLDYHLWQAFDGEMYESTDYSKDGTLHVIQSSSEGNGIDVVMLGSYFSDRLIEHGDYQRMMDITSDAFFKEEPFKTFRDLFNVYSIDVVSPNEVGWGESALGTYDDFVYYASHPKILEYVRKHFTDEQIDDMVIILLDRRERAGGGRCAMYINRDVDYGRGLSIAYVVDSFGDAGDANGYYTYLVQHEAGGHGFGKLHDEYWTMGSHLVCPESEKSFYNELAPYGFYRNVDFTNDASKVKWSSFLSDPRYSSENLGCYEGGCHFEYGAYRPRENSIMKSDPDSDFNAPSRYAIWYRINKLAFGEEWQGTYEDFVEYDKVNRTPAAIAKRQQQRRNYVEQDFEPLAPPVIINKDWRELFGGQ